MSYHRSVAALILAFAFFAAAPAAHAQGKSGDRGKQSEAKGKPDRGKAARVQRGQGGQDRGQAANRQATGQSERGNRGNPRADDRGRGNAPDHDRTGSPARGAAGKVNRADGHGRYSRNMTIDDVKPRLRGYATSKRAPERIAAGAASRGIARGLDEDDVVIRRNGDRVSVLNRAGVLLVDLDDERARNLGGWRVTPWDNEVAAGAPAFCRSGAGHPVFGREWCLDKGFGLGDYRDLRWGRTTDARDIIFHRTVDRGTLARAVLIDVLGDVVFDRLGLHALTLGYSDPLTGVWLAEPTGPRVLRLSSGTMPIAEIYDADRDDRADVLVVALRPW